MLERQVRFIFEKRTELYKQYCSGASEKKIVHGAKKLAVLPALQEGRLTDMKARNEL